MDLELQKHIASLRQPGRENALRGIRRGIEKESLRITGSGRLAQTPHPAAIGSALTHPRITTDYSEALLEFITGAGTDAEATLAELTDIHRFVYPRIGEELLWTSSMPCILETDAEIPVARYGSSNVARMKTIYRVGLGHRYGRRMQTIAGVHFNFSVSDALWEWLRETTGSPLDVRALKTERYFALIRNFHRWSWLLVYLFGASPALCRSFVEGREHALEPFTKGTLYAPYGTALRMGDLGYQSNAQGEIDVAYNNLDDYLRALRSAISTPHAAYERIGTRRDGEWQQLSTSLLQIENEFYSTIRPKRVTRSGESPRKALAERGVEYIEVRCLDLDPFEPAGIALGTMRFLDAFLLYCLLSSSPETDAAERARVRDNLRAVVYRGREPGLRLKRCDGTDETLAAWAGSMLDAIAPIAALLDASHGGDAYAQSLAAQRAKVADPECTPSARVLAEMRAGDLSFFRFAMGRSEQTRDWFLQHPLDARTAAAWEDDAAESLAEQRRIEDADSIGFEQYLATYFSQ